jgi:dihydroorotate dehydrogenase (NAD+) catalytic subunit
LEFILAGASAVQVGTVIFHDPGAPARVSRELREALAARGMDRLDQAIGLAHRAPELIVPELPDPPGDVPDASAEETESPAVVVPEENDEALAEDWWEDQDA